MICQNGKIYIPKTLQKRIVQWYHEQLCHPGENRTELTIRQHFTWTNMKETIDEVCGKCRVCQLCKKDTKKYGLLPEKEAEANPWQKLCVDLIGPYTLTRKGKPPLTLWCVTMIDPATGWFEMKSIKTKKAIVVANTIEQTWLTRYPRPDLITYDKGSEFMAEFAKMIDEDYGIKKKPITTRNPQSNSILERIHQTLGNMIRTFEINDIDVDDEDPWAGILSAVMFATRATYHTTLKATPMQLVFGRDAILNTQFEADWTLIKNNKQKIIHKNNVQENSTRKPYTYLKNQWVLMKTEQIRKFGKSPYIGPFKIRVVNDNGTVIIKKGSILETVNVRLIKPYR